jgi:nicotinamidase-related amidase
MAIWDDVVPATDLAVYRAGGYGKPQGFGERPALLIIDVNYSFVGHEPQPILDSVKLWRNSCGERGWEGVRQIRTLLDGARRAGIPVIYSTAARLPGTRGLRPGKNYRSGDRVHLPGFSHDGSDIVDEIAPVEDELVIRKQRASVFFGTTLVSYLIGRQVDTLLVAGTTTSGCVRASVVDAHSYDFRVSIVQECVFDRWEISHKIALFDLHAKYADVVTLQETLPYLERVTTGRFPEPRPAGQ